MQINNNTNLMFGRVTLGKCAEATLNKRLNSGEFASILPKMIEANAKNPIEVFIESSGKDRLYCTMKYLKQDHELFFKYIKEGYFEKLFKNPLNFIRKAISKANEAQKNIGL